MSRSSDSFKQKQAHAYNVSGSNGRRPRISNVSGSLSAVD